MHQIEQNLEKLDEDPEYAMEELADALIPQLNKDTNMYDELLTLLEESIDTLATEGEHKFESTLNHLINQLLDIRTRQYQTDDV